MKRHNDLPLKEALQLFVQQYKHQSRLNQVRVERLWEKLMGPSIKNYTESIRFRGKKVYITISSAPLRQELSYNKEKIALMLNEHLGAGTVDEVIVK